MSKPTPLNEAMSHFTNDTNIKELFKFNLFSEQIEYNSQPFWNTSTSIDESITDEDITYIRYYLTSVHNFEPNKNIVSDSCFLIARERSYHPLKEYIEKENWDGISRLDEWLIKAVGCEDNIYTRSVGAKFLIASVNRVYNPGCKFDHMLILEGSQGIGKSTMIEELAGEFYLDTSFEHKDKDLVDSICQAFLVEISELSGMTKKDVDWMKSFITRKVDRIRLPYASRTKDFKRKCVFIGTYNPSGNNTYLRDDTGNRRFWPIECENIDLKYLKSVKGQLWAEAYERYKKSERYYIEDGEALNILKNLHKDREFEGPNHSIIKKWLEIKPRNYVEMEEIISDALCIKQESKSMREMSSTWSIIGIIMRKLNWKKGTNRNRNRYYPCNGFYNNINNEELWEE